MEYIILVFDQKIEDYSTSQVETIEVDLTVLLNLKCEEIQEFATPIMAESTDKFQIRKLPKGVEFHSLSIHVNCIKVNINYFML